MIYSGVGSQCADQPGRSASPDCAAHRLSHGVARPHGANPAVRCGDEQQNHQRVLGLREEFLPTRYRLFRRQLIAAHAFEARPRLNCAQAALHVRTERGEDRIYSFLIRWRFIFLPRQQNLWVVSGSGSLPKL